MNEFYALSIKREKQEDYCLPMSLEMIDTLFTNYSKLEVLKYLKNMDSVIDENDPDKMCIKKFVHGKYIEEKYTYIITDPFYLNFPLENIPFDLAKNEKLGNVLYNHLLPFKNRHISVEFEEAIDALKVNKACFMEKFVLLSYAEKRIIRTIIASKINVDLYVPHIEVLKDPDLTLDKEFSLERIIGKEAA